MKIDADKGAKRLEYDLLMTPEERKQQEAKNSIEEQSNKHEIFDYDGDGDEDISDHLKSLFDNLETDVHEVKVLFVNSQIMMGIAAMVVIIIVGYIGITGINGVIHHFTEQGEWTGTISELHYHRERYVENYTILYDETWWDTVPAMGYNPVDRGQHVRGSHNETQWSTCRKSKTVEDDDGEGTHTEYYNEGCWVTVSVDDYDKWVSYSYNGWDLYQTFASDERQNKSEYGLTAMWPVIPPLYRELGSAACGVSAASTNPADQSTDPLLGCQRISARTSEAYWITYHYKIGDEPFSFECGINQELWATLKISNAAYGKYFSHNKGFDCNDGHLGIKPTETPPTPSSK